ncbi:MAG TPA: metallophosphoesterase, partial [Polyangiaceae bacterium]
MRSLGQFILFLTIALAIVAAWQFYIWTRLVRDPAWPEPYARIATVLLVLVTVLPPIVVFTSRYLPRAVVKGFAVSLYTWFGMAFLLGLAFFAADLARWIVRGIAALAGNAPPHDPERRQLVARTVAEAAGLGVAALGAVSVRSALADVGVEEVDVRLARLPRALSGLTIVQLTDIHIGPTIGRKFLEHVVEKSNAQKPDAIVITGDLVDGSVASLRSHVEPLSKLEARYGVYFVTGNHEYYSGVEEWMAELERLGVRVLRNERVTLGDRTASIDLAGVDDQSAKGFSPAHGA